MMNGNAEANAPREMLLGDVRRLLVGPFSENEVIPASPSDTYLTGVLWPKGSMLTEAEDDAGEMDREGESDGAADQAVPGYRSIRPCSIGITCAVDASATIAIRLHGSARYVASETAVEVPQSGAQADRGNGEGSSVLVAPSERNEAKSGRKGRKSEAPATAGEPTASVRQRYEWGRAPLNLSVSIGPDEHRNEWRTHDFTDDDGKPVTDRGLELHIRRRRDRNQVVLTVTLINCAPEGAGVERAANCIYQARVTLDAVTPEGNPAICARKSVLHTDEEDSRSNALLYRHVCEFAVGHGVAVEWVSSDIPTVRRVGTTWLPVASVAATSAAGHPRLGPLAIRTPNPFAAEWLGDVQNRKQACDALAEMVQIYEGWIEQELSQRADGIEPSFALALSENRERCRLSAARIGAGVNVLRTSDAAWRAFALANRAMDMQARFAAKGDKAGALIWRPFQLAFMLLVIPSLVRPEDTTRNCMDLLWFPTGGGKTEAYLGLTAFQILLERLRQPTRRDVGGVDVLMRYTLRLLTIQQFQRAAALITACEMLRRADPELGSARISLGLYVGGDSTPNSLTDAIERLKEERQGGRPSSTPRQLLSCPVCGVDLNSRSYRWTSDETDIVITCPSDKCATHGFDLPVMTTDELIYRRAPSLLIGTVDKFAQLPRSEKLRTLFGLDGPLRPELIIQDELHLISGPLGSMTGLFESAIDMLCTTPAGHRPKIIGSTATIGRAGAQVRALFDRDVLQFPPPGQTSFDSFFAVRDLEAPSRLYLGVATAGRSPKFALQAVIAALLQSVHAYRGSGKFTDAQLDPYWTCVAYFNSLRELGGAHVLMLDDVPRQMQFLAHRLGGKPRPISEPPLELSSRVPSRSIPEYLQRLSHQLGVGDAFEPEPVSTVLASNMISVGVDIPRLGLMVVNGQPKSTAEFIQASSRIGRGNPGLVVTLYNVGRPRDLSHFEHFLAYHGALYRAVEATSVTPWAPRARDKALHAAFIALVRHLVPGMSGDKDAIRFDPENASVQRIIDELVRRAAAGSTGLEDKQTRKDLEEIVHLWAARVADSNGHTKPLRYWIKRAPFGNTSPHLMMSAEQAERGPSAAWPTPNSMRDVEPSTAFLFRDVRRQPSQGGADGDATAESE